MIDDFNREGVGIEVDFSSSAERMTSALEQIIEWRGQPGILRCDNGLGYISGVMQTQANNEVSVWSIYSPANRNRTRTLNVTTGPFAMIGSVTTYSITSLKYVTLRPAGYGPTIMIDTTWDWDVSPRNRSWPSQPNLYF